MPEAARLLESFLARLTLALMSAARRKERETWDPHADVLQVVHRLKPKWV